MGLPITLALASWGQEDEYSVPSDLSPLVSKAASDWALRALMGVAVPSNSERSPTKDSLVRVAGSLSVSEVTSDAKNSQVADQQIQRSTPQQTVKGIVSEAHIHDVRFLACCSGSSGLSVVSTGEAGHVLLSGESVYSRPSAASGAGFSEPSSLSTLSSSAECRSAVNVLTPAHLVATQPDMVVSVGMEPADRLPAKHLGLKARFSSSDASFGGAPAISSRAILPDLERRVQQVLRERHKLARRYASYNRVVVARDEDHMLGQPLDAAHIDGTSMPSSSVGSSPSSASKKTDSDSSGSTLPTDVDSLLTVAGEEGELVDPFSNRETTAQDESCSTLTDHSLASIVETGSGEAPTCSNRCREMSASSQGGRVRQAPQVQVNVNSLGDLASFLPRNGSPIPNSTGRPSASEECVASSRTVRYIAPPTYSKRRVTCDSAQLVHHAVSHGCGGRRQVGNWKSQPAPVRHVPSAGLTIRLPPERSLSRSIRAV
ncbi:unnamed protein product [Parajaminaea phylloscopi]